MEIRFVKHTEIDFQRWNTCIKQSPNCLIYGFAEYLNSMCECWDALILDDYKAVMPLTRRKKFGVVYLYQPPFVQQSGIFGNVDELTCIRFIETAQKLFKFAEIHLNFKNKIQEGIERKNQVINLNKKYSTLVELYSSHTKRKVEQARKAKTVYKEIDSPINIDAFNRLLGKRIPHVKNTVYENLKKFCKTNPEQALSRGVFLGSELASSITALRDHNRIYIITPVNHNPEKYVFTSHALIDQLINEFSNMELVLDFEGSDLPGVFAFNESFGAVNEPYFFYKWNRLPWPVKFLKR